MQTLGSYFTCFKAYNKEKYDAFTSPMRGFCVFSRRCTLRIPSMLARYGSNPMVVTFFHRRDSFRQQPVKPDLNLPVSLPKFTIKRQALVSGLTDRKDCWASLS